MSDDQDRLHIINNAPNYGPQGIFNAPVSYYRVVENPPDRNRTAMLEKVKAIWITGLLAHSLADIVRIDLNMIGQPDEVFFPLYADVQELTDVLPSLPTSTSIIDIFTAYAGQLLILGDPGTGKTTLLLELARDLIIRAERDSSHPIPVVFNLSSWTERRGSLSNWLVDELNRAYDVPQRIAQAWVKQGALLPLLDGLDEVGPLHGAVCIDRINAYRTEHGLIPLAICSRTGDYRALGKKLRLQGAVVIQKLTAARVEAYIHQNHTGMERLGTALAGDSELRMFADTPLMLHVLALVYQQEGVQIEVSQRTPDELRQSIFNAYVDAMFQRRGKVMHYSKEQVIRSLELLARSMLAHTQTVFYLEFMQPDWLPQSVQYQFNQYIGVLRGALVGIGVGLIVGAFGLFAISMLWSEVSQYFGGSGIALSTANSALGAVVCSAGFGLAFALIGLFSASRDRVERISLVEHVEWSPKALRRGAMLGLCVGLVAGVTMSMAYGPGIGVLIALTLAFALWLLVLVRDAGWRDEEVRTVPNQGVWRSARNALLISLGVGISSGSAIGLITAVILSIGQGIVLGTSLGVATGLFMWLYFGGETYIKHFLLRAMLVHRGIQPWNLPQVLQVAIDRVLLRHLGGGYVFVHRLLLEYFAAKDHSRIKPDSA